MARAGSYWEGRRVLITGHTGFKGAWLAAWLSWLDARVTGFALAPPTDPSLFDLAQIGERVDSCLGDIRDRERFKSTLAASRPEVVFHLAAQPLVRAAYAQPLETFAVNVMGLCQVLDAIRGQASVRTVIVVTSDKCYRNLEGPWPFRESDPLGGHDPYSASKACQELAAAAWHASFLKDSGVRLATVRAGNVIGGGDFAEDRLVPDLVRAAVSGRPTELRCEGALRPWQHVLDVLAAYLLVAERLASSDELDATSWNFGPDGSDTRSAAAIADGFATCWGPGSSWVASETDYPREAQLLQLDSSLARARLGWCPRWGIEEALVRTVAWYRAWHQGEDCLAATTRDIADYGGA